MKLAGIIGLLFIAMSLRGQVMQFSNDFFYVKVVPVKDYTGRQYRFAVDMKNVSDDTVAYIDCMALQVGKSDYDFLKYDFGNKPAKDTQWHTYAID